MNTSLLGFKAYLSQPLDTYPDAVLAFSERSTRALCEALGDKTSVLVVSHPSGSEAIKVACRHGYIVAVERGLDCSAAQQHPAGSCVEFVSLPVDGCSVVASICSDPVAFAELKKCLGLV